jgi:ubiquinone/menaquinone biosynthesis C-methylase UbiE
VEEGPVSDEAEARKAQTKAFFSSLAPDYDAAGSGTFAHFGRRLVSVVGVEPGQRVLDVACGRGAVLFPAAERAGDSGEVVGVDLAEGMVQTTNAEAASRGATARAVVMDAEHLDFPDAVFDRVFCGFGIMFFPNLDRALAECRRVLKPGGRLGVSTWRVAETEDLADVMDQLGFPQNRPRGWITEPDDLVGSLVRAGFRDVQVVVDSETFCYADLEQYWQTARSTGRRRALDALDAAQTASVRAALAERLRARQRPDGIHVEATALLAVASR